MVSRTNYDEATRAAEAARDIDAAQHRNDWARGASAIGADDGLEKIIRIERALPTTAEPDRGMLLRELDRLRAAAGLVPTVALAAE